MRRTIGIAAVALLALAGGCSDDGGGDGGGGEGADGTDAPVEVALPDACQQPPLTMTLFQAGDEPAGSESFEVTDAVARRVAIVPNAEYSEDPDVRQGYEDQAASTPLAMYSLYLADHPVDRSQLTGFGFGSVSPEPGGTVGTVTIVPTTEDGFATGDVVTDGELEYDAVTTFSPLGLIVLAEGGTMGAAYSETQGQVEILHLDDSTICLDVDVQFLLDDEVVASAVGVVAADVERADPSFYFT